jgi:hypothetical protein
MMARLLLVTLAASLASVSGVAQSAEKPANPWQSPKEARPALTFDIPDEEEAIGSSARGSRIIAGTEVIPNAVVGIGMFGQKTEKAPLPPVVARELAIPKSRKAAVGFSFKF